MYELTTFGLTDVLECSSRLRRLGDSATSMEEAARAVVRFLYDSLLEKDTGEPALALVRLYKTHRYDELEPALQAFADQVTPAGSPLSTAPCLTLLATAGQDPAWNDRCKSKSHQAIPLPSSAALEASPMVFQLIRQFGLNAGDVVAPDPRLFRQNEGRPCGIFYVPEALGSDHVPAQDFVRRYGIRSVLGFGGVLPSGYVFAVVMFSKVAIPPATADVFASLSFAVLLALLPFVEQRVFDSDPPLDVSLLGADHELRMARAEANALQHLLDARQDVVIEQSLRLELALHQAEERALALDRSRRQLSESEARKTAILDSALDCIITIDSEGRILEFNPAAERTFGYDKGEAIGQLLSALIIPSRFRQRHMEGLRRYAETGEGPILGQRIEIVAVRADGVEFPVELTVTPVKTGGVGLFSGYIRDISERVAAANALREASQRSEHIAQTLQATLLPPTLPVIPGIEIASAYRPATDGLEVGGDFYDVFEIGRDDWGLVLGDVMGKGTEAAALTALTRYTVRAAAIRVRRPTAVLNVLNDAVYRHDRDRFCTAIYVRLRLGDPPRITLASGGHPPALLRTASDVVTLEARGSLLGCFQHWVGSDRRVTLHPGNLLLLYSDGVTEARNGADFFGAERLVQLLRAQPQLNAADTVALVLSEVASYTARPTDDIAIVALRVPPHTPGGA